MRTKIKLLKKISLDNLGKIVTQPLNKSFQNFKKKRAEEIAKKIKKEEIERKKQLLKDKKQQQKDYLQKIKDEEKRLKDLEFKKQKEEYQRIKEEKERLEAKEKLRLDNEKQQKKK